MDVQRPKVQPADEFRHDSPSDALWNESYYFDFVADGGELAGYVRLGFYPNEQVAWWTAAFVGEGRDPIIVASHDLVLATGHQLSLTAGTHEIELDPAVALESFSVRAKGNATSYDHHRDAYVTSASGRDVGYAIDLVWETDGEPFHYWVTTRYEIPCLVSGTIELDGTRYAISGQGQRDHSWGVRDWWSFPWCWAAARLDDGTRLHVADIRLEGGSIPFGYVQHLGTTEVVSELFVTETLDEFGFPTAAVIDAGPMGLIVGVEPVAYGGVLLVADDGRLSRFPRALVRVTTGDGRRGMGWIEWNQPQQ